MASVKYMGDPDFMVLGLMDNVPKGNIKVREQLLNFKTNFTV